MVETLSKDIYQLVKNSEKKLTFTDEFLVVINSSVSMFPLNLQLTPTHSYIIAPIIKGCLWNVYLIQLSHVTINKRYFYIYQSDK